MSDANTRRHFFDWSAPFLPRLADLLLPDDDPNHEADLSTTLVVLPGARAGRLLTGFLVDAAEQRGRALIPPDVITPSAIVGKLLARPTAPAEPLARRLAWIAALGRTEDVEKAALAPPSPTDQRRLAAILERLSDSLAAEGRRFDRIATALGPAVPPEEHDRWRALATLQDAYESALADANLTDPALFALCGPPAPRRRPRVVIAAVTELSAVQRAALLQGAREILACIYAPASHADDFDELGTLIPTRWADREIELSDEHLEPARDAEDQAERALLHVASITPPVAPEDVVIGAASPGDLPALRRLARRAAGVVIRDARGQSALRTRPGRLLASLTRFAEDQSFDAALEMLRHPDVESAVRRFHPSAPADLIDRLDRLRRDRVVVRLETRPARLDDRDAEALSLLQEASQRLWGAITTSPGAPRSRRDWAGMVLDGFRAVYGDVDLSADRDADRRTTAALLALRSAIDELRGAGPLAEPVSEARETLALLTERVGESLVPEPVSRDAIEALGWLELLTDPAPHCVVIGLTEASVPGASGPDPFLPDSQRVALGLPSAADRLARDIYLMTALAASRRLHVFTSQVDTAGDPQTPSRLLLRCKGARLAARVRRLIGSPAPPVARLTTRTRPAGGDSFRPVPAVLPGYQPPATMSASDFNAYLRSPLGWYLERYLRLRPVEEVPHELTPMTSGRLAHRALELYGRDPAARDLTDPDELAEALTVFLDRATAEAVGTEPSIAVRLQKHLLERRLRLMAPDLACRRREGWEMVHLEWSPAADAECAFDVDGVPVRLRGVIDRIDIRGDEWTILDYKTGARDAKGPAATHRRRSGEWTNLQLPLYRRLAASLGPPRAIHFGYLTLPEKEGTPSESLAGWSTADLDDADEAAREVVRALRALKPGDPLAGGAHPPEAGSLGYLSGERFEPAGDTDGDDDDEADA